MTYPSVSVSYSVQRPPAAPNNDLLAGLGQLRRQDFDAARTMLLRALRRHPNNPRCAYAVGMLYMLSGSGRAALVFFNRAFLLAPDNLAYLHALMYGRLRARRFDSLANLISECERRGLAVDLARWRRWMQQVQRGADPATLDGLEPPALPPDPSPDDALREGRIARPIQSAAHPQMQEDFSQALKAANEERWLDVVDQTAAGLDAWPDWGEGHHLSGYARLRAGHVQRALPHLYRAAEILSGRADVFDHLGLALTHAEQHQAAESAFEMALALAPTRAVSWNNAAHACIEAEQFELGFQYAQVGLALDDQTPALVLNFARGAQGIGQLQLAQRALTQLLQAWPDFARAEQQLGQVLIELGQHEQALAAFGRVLEKEPANSGALSSQLFLCNYIESESQADLFARAKAFARALAQGLPEVTHEPVSDADLQAERRRPLRIGFVSGDFRRHSVGSFFWTVLDALSQATSLVLYAYSATRSADDLTVQMQRRFRHWRLIAGLSDEVAARQIRADAIDILVDLSGHTKYHRLGVFARKPAPIQATWLGYFGTTGLSEIDYLLAGKHDVLPSEERWYAERVWRFSESRLCFAQPDIKLAVAEPPCLQAGNLVFGNFSTIKKITGAVIRVWVDVLHRVPGAELLIKAKELGSDAARADMRQRFRAAGLRDDQRLRLEGPSPFAQYMAAYAKVDIVLDTFPYTGGTTTMQALWMGVPVLTMAGDRLLSRQGESMLRILERDDWIASDASDYVMKAQTHAEQPQLLRAMRQILRSQLEASPLMDAHRMARDLETAFAAMWDRHINEVAMPSTGGAGAVPEERGS